MDAPRWMPLTAIFPRAREDLGTVDEVSTRGEWDALVTALREAPSP